jgi:hypothetical protein
LLSQTMPSKRARCILSAFLDDVTKQQSKIYTLEEELKKSTIFIT